MKGTTINYRGENYIREVSMIGDVEKVRWYLEKDFVEIYAQESLDILEDAYMETCMAEITPQPFYI